MHTRNAQTPQRLMQDTILAAWHESSMVKQDVRRLVPTINPGTLARYLDGDRTAFLRERTAEFLLAALRDGPKGPKVTR